MLLRVLAADTTKVIFDACCRAGKSTGMAPRKDIALATENGPARCWAARAQMHAHENLNQG
jgi:hypothetical protein